MATPAPAANLSALGKALDQATISSPGGDSPTSLSMTSTTTASTAVAVAVDVARSDGSGGGGVAATRKSPKKRDRTDSLKKMLPSPAAQRARQGTDDGGEENENETEEATADDNGLEVALDLGEGLEEEEEEDEEDGEDEDDIDGLEGMDGDADGDGMHAEGVAGEPASERVIKLPVKDRTGRAVKGVARAHLISNAVKTAPPAKEKSNPRRWSKHEDESLRLAVERSGERNWKAIAEQVPGRNHTQCLQRWTKVLKPGLIKGHWDPEEDSKLRDLVSEGKRNWGQVASLIPGRTSKQCRERWCNHLDPNINKGVYTEEEDRIILEMQAKLGNRWSIIAQQLKGRTEDAVKIRWKSLMRGKKAASKDGKFPVESSSAIIGTSSAASAIPVPEEKPVRAKPARPTPTRQKTRAASPVTKSAEYFKTDTQAMTDTVQPTQMISQMGVSVAANNASGSQAMDSKHVAASINSYMQNVNDIVAASIHNFNMNQNYPSGVQVGVPAAASMSSGATMSSHGQQHSNHPSSMSQSSTISPPNQPVYAYPPNMYSNMSQGQRAYGMNAQYAVPPNMNLPPNYVYPTSGVHTMHPQLHGQYYIGGQVQSSGALSSAAAYGSYPSGTMNGNNMNNPNSRSYGLQMPGGYQSQSMTMASSGMVYSAGMSSVPQSYNLQSNSMSSAYSGVTTSSSSIPPPSTGNTHESLVPVSAGLPLHPSSLGSKLTTPREEWGSSQTPRSHLIMTEGHASAYELFHQQRLRLMLKEREKGMSLTSAPSPGQALLTYELKANKERQKRQEMMQQGWKGAVDAMMSLNSDEEGPSMDDSDALMGKVDLSALDPTDDELLDTPVEINIQGDDTVVDGDDPITMDHD